MSDGRSPERRQEATQKPASENKVKEFWTYRIGSQKSGRSIKVNRSLFQISLKGFPISTSTQFVKLDQPIFPVLYNGLTTSA
jgi:hypothetical protein